MVIVVAFGIPIELLKRAFRSSPLPSVLEIPHIASDVAIWRSQGCGAALPPAASDGHRW